MAIVEVRAPLREEAAEEAAARRRDPGGPAAGRLGAACAGLYLVAGSDARTWLPESIPLIEALTLPTTSKAHHTSTFAP